MRRFLINLSVALIAFTIGVTTAAVFGVTLLPRVRHSHRRTIQMSPPPMSHGCPKERLRSFELPPLPELPEPPAPPAAPKTSEEKVIRVRRPDGTVEVIELRTERRVEKKF